MVYLPFRTLNRTCGTTYFDRDEVDRCQEAGQQPYCWPPNGTRICGGVTKGIPFYWPPNFYNENAYFFVDFGSQVTEGSDNHGEIRAEAASTNLTGFERHAERLSNSTWNDEKVLRITIREWYPVFDSISSAVHDGPTLIIVPPEETATASASPTSSAISNSGSSNFGTGKIIGITFGALVGTIFILMLVFSFCKNCCILGPGKRETARVRRLQARRLERERAAVQPQIDAIKESVRRGELWTGPVRPGGMWAVDLPRRASRPPSRASDEIHVVTVLEEQRAEERRIEERRIEERRIEERRIEERRIEERRIEERRQEIARAEEVDPPAYEEAPPKYTP